MVLLLLAGIGIGWVAFRVQRTRRQQEAVQEITNFGGKARYDYQPPPSNRPVDGLTRSPLLNSDPPGPAWIRHLLGENFFATLVDVNLASSSVTDAGLGHLLNGLTELQTLNLGGTRVTDAGLEHLEVLTQLQSLDLYGTQVTDAGLEHLKGLTQLHTLGLHGTHVTDAGLEHLKGLTQLLWLYLGNTQVTDEGVKRLKQALPKCEVNR